MCATTKAARRRVGAERRGGFSERACLRAQHSVLHNSTHTIFLLHQMNQFLQNFIQHPEGAERERGRKTSFITFTVVILSTMSSPPRHSVPALDVEVLPQHQVFDGGMPGKRREDGQ